MEPRNSQNVSFKGKTVRFRKKGASGGSIFSHASGHIFRDLVACIFVILALGSCENSPPTFSKSAPSLFQNQPLHFFKTTPLTLGETGHLDGFVKNHRSFIPHTANLHFQKVLLLEGTNWKFKFRTKERENKKYILYVSFFFLSILNFKFKLVFSSENTICKLNFTPFRITKRALIFDKASEVTSFAQSEGAGFEKVKGLILKK